MVQKITAIMNPKHVIAIADLVRKTWTMLRMSCYYHLLQCALFLVALNALLSDGKR